MAANYSYDEDNSAAKFEFQAEELRKRLQFSMANFALLKFKRSMQMQMKLTLS